MRIEAYTQVQQLYNATKPAKLQGMTGMKIEFS